MFESTLSTAFIIGLVSAASLPLGSVTAFFWRPGDRVMAVLMAFGGGALLAALTIDLVASALEEGRFNELAIGAIIGGLLFLGLNRIVNDYGGFLRKVSTTVYYLRRRQHQQIRGIARKLKRVNLFEDLGNADFRMLAASIRSVDIKQGGWIYQSGDPSDYLYILMEGSVELVDPAGNDVAPEHLGKYDMFGWRAMLTGSPFSYSAQARSDVHLLLVPRSVVDMLNLNSAEFRQRVLLLLDSPSVMQYLQQEQGFTAEAASQWLDAAAYSLNRDGRIDPARDVVRNNQVFCDRLPDFSSIPLLQDLSDEVQVLLSTRLIYRHYRRGQSFYHKNESAERMFFIDQGEVNLVGIKSSRHAPAVMHSNEVFGDISMITGAKHSVTAVAAVDTRVWVLRKADFEDLLEEAPELRERVRAYVQLAAANDYLVQRHNIDVDHITRWVHQALRNVDAGLPVPAVANIQREFSENKAAPIAIWLGITLDGIPESLVIGASMIHAQLPLSLIAGLFLSNYPEALSSSTGMLRQGMSRRRIFVMWSSLMLFTGIGAVLGSVFFIGASPGAFALVEGIAAGAMLTMIAETMLPEAYFKGGSVVGLSTLVGFLVAIFFKTLE